VRPYNEDAFLNAPEFGLWAVADGMGGHTAGDVASRMVVERLARVRPAATAAQSAATIDAALAEVNRDLIRIARERGVRLIGATVAVLAACADGMACGWAGDSRIYRWRGALQRMTRDHSSAQEMIDTGVFTVEQLQGKAVSNAVTRAVGGDAQLTLEWNIGPREAGARFLLCSDGLTKELTDPLIAAELARPAPPAQTVAKLIGAALEHGGRDNVTAVVVDVP
jgi:serine/threonine protein phosphatase PrpC